jgi:hypothetical protein
LGARVRVRDPVLTKGEWHCGCVVSRMRTAADSGGGGGGGGEGGRLLVRVDGWNRAYGFADCAPPIAASPPKSNGAVVGIAARTTTTTASELVQ